MVETIFSELPATDESGDVPIVQVTITRRAVPAALLVGTTVPGEAAAQGGGTVRKAELDAVQAVARDALPRAGGTMTGMLALSADPTARLHAATKGYVDQLFAGIPASAGTLPSTTHYGPYDVRRFGAIGDGTPHPVSEWLVGGARPRRAANGQAYTNLASIRTDYPHVRSLTDEIDWAAIQAAVDEAMTNGGGVVTAPSGVFVLDRTVWFPETSASVLTAAQDAHGSPERGVSFAGAGEGSTFLWWRSDLGVGHYAFECRNRASTGAGSAGYWRDFTMCGPGTNVNMGTYNCGMSGLGWGSRRHVINVWTVNFRYGISIIGDQGLFQRYSSHACFYGVYFDKPNPLLFGDHQFDKCVLHGRMAGVGIHPAADLPKGLWNTPIFGACPYGIWKEIDPTVPGAKDMAMVSVTMNSPQFENIGMEAISGGTMQSYGVKALAPIKAQEVRLVQAQFGGRNDEFACRYQSGPQRNEIMPRPAMINIQETYQHFIIDGVNEEHLCWIGDEAMFKILVPRGFKVINTDLSNSDSTGLIDRCFIARKPFLLHYHGGTLTSLGNGVYLEQSGKAWWGHVRELAPGLPATSRFMPMVSAGGLVRNVGAKPDEDARGTDLAELQFKGVLLHTNDCNGGSSVCYASGGVMPVLAAAGAHGFLRVGYDGRAVSGHGNVGPRAGTALSVVGDDGSVSIDLVGA